MTDTIFHASLGASLQGVHDPKNHIVHFRGIPYGTIPRRFAAAEKITLAEVPSSETIDCTKFGPRCPQVPIDVGHLLRIPASHVLPAEQEDEFKCLNLDITIPEQYVAAQHSRRQARRRLPVMIYIHGGSQAVTFCSAASGICDMPRIVSDSVASSEPIIAVFVQYRLNVFCHGDGTGPKNLALSDQTLAIQWVYGHISSFGGDPENITLAGESAGAVFIHAHITIGNPIIKQCILLSGTLYLSPPQPRSVIDSLRGRVLGVLHQLDSTLTLENAPADKIVQAMTSLGHMSWFLEEEGERLGGWRDRTYTQRLLVSDVQNESVIWRSGLWTAPTTAIVEAFRHAPPKLAEIYSIDASRPGSCVLGALDFLNDLKFLLPAEILAFRAAVWNPYILSAADGSLGPATPEPGGVYRCIIDEVNPWQGSHGAHHGVDLLLLFGGFDAGLLGPDDASPSSSSSGFVQTGRDMRGRFIKFINGGEPWDMQSVGTFGPWGTYKELHRGPGGELSMRRRMGHLDVLRKVETDVLEKVFMDLARGRISLLN